MRTIDSKRFWKTVKPFFTEKAKASNKTILTEHNKSLKEKWETMLNLNTISLTSTKDLIFEWQEKTYHLKMRKLQINKISLWK